eukprot:snap_masked-scaffold_5-processed-gene-3.3-mRNA-1 protein AED:1.00 eAED:1.00 QI:0/-1/0/0/-1/1/1/0/238
MRKKIAVLQTCSSDEYGNLSVQMLTDFLEGNIINTEGHVLNVPNFELKAFNVLDDQYPQEEELYSAVVIMGSFSSATEDHPWIQKLMSFIQEWVSSDNKLLGICFGHQIVTRALGGRVYTKDKSFYGKKTTKIIGLGETFEILYSHNDAVILPKLEGIEGNADMFSLKKKDLTKVLCFQGHPEYMTPFGVKSVQLQIKLLEKDSKVDKAETFKRGLNEMKVTDTLEIRNYILEFLQTA